MSVRSGDIPIELIAGVASDRARRRSAQVAARRAAATRAAIIQRMSRWFRTYGFADVFDDLIVGAYPLDEDDVDTLAAAGDRARAEPDRGRRIPRRAIARRSQRAFAAAGIVEHRLRLTDYGGLPADRSRPRCRRSAAGWTTASARTSTAAPAGSGRPRSPPASSPSAPASTSTRRSPSSAGASRRPIRCRTSATDLRRWWDGRAAGSTASRRADPRAARLVRRAQPPHRQLLGHVLAAGAARAGARRRARRRARSGR